MTLSYPLGKKGTISSGYGYRVHPIKKTKKHHNGIDIAVPDGTSVKSIADGKVVRSDMRDRSGYGNFMIVKHDVGGETFYSAYAHLTKRLKEVGDSVKNGEEIAKSGGGQGVAGGGGLSTGPHLHFEIRKSETGQWVNPKPYLDGEIPAEDIKSDESKPSKVENKVIDKIIYTNFSTEDKKIIDSVLTKLKKDNVTNIYAQIVLISMVLWKLNGVEESDGELDFINELPLEIKTALKKVEDCFDEKIIGDHLASEKKQEGVDYYPDNGGVDSNAKKSLLKLLSAFALKYPEVKNYSVVSDYRSYDKQVLAFCKKTNSEKKISERQKWSALPGFSQHSTGKTFDLFSVEPEWWNSRPNLKNWLRDNASDYGFKVSYPSKGVLREPEPWHIYYVGGSINESVEIDSDVEKLISGASKENFKSLDEALNYFDKKLGDDDFNKEEVKKIAEKFEVSVNDENNKKIEVNLDGLKQFFKKFDEIYGEKKEEVNEDINRMKNIMKKIL